MIAIRGIHIKNVTAESMDICAIWWLTRNDPSLKICTLLFSEYQMNYFQQLLDFVSEVRVSYLSFSKLNSIESTESIEFVEDYF